jgi:hypothetical protein
LSRNDLEDTRTRAPMEIMMAGLPENICLITFQPVESVIETYGSLRTALSQKARAGATESCDDPKGAPSRE